MPSFTPGLIFTVYVLMRRSRPEPWQCGHGFSITVPLPRQRGHGCESAKSPCDSAFTPRPLHSGQMTGAVPGCAPVPPQSRQAVVISTGHLHLGAVQRVLERELHLCLDVGAA